MKLYSHKLFRCRCTLIVTMVMYFVCTIAGGLMLKRQLQWQIRGGRGAQGSGAPNPHPTCNHAHYQQPCNLVWKLISDHRVAMATLSYFTEYRLKNTLAIFKTHNEASPGSNDLCTILTYTYCHMISFAHEKTEYDICVPLFCFFLTLPEFSVTCQ